MTAKIQNGSCVPLLQHTFSYADFTDFIIILLEGDNVFLYHGGDVDVMSFYNDCYCFYDCWSWSKDNVIS